MSANTSIEWTDTTWNPVRGCSIVSPGCVNCYAMKQAHRFNWEKRADEEVNGVPLQGPYFGLTKQTKAGPQWTGTIRLAEDRMLDPLRWNKPRRVFVNSMSDLFHERITDDAIDRLFAVMAMAHWHTFQVLTKRAERMRSYFADANTRERINLEITMLLEGYEPDENYPKSLQVDPLVRRSDDARATAPDVESDEAWPLPNVWLGVSVEDQKHADERIQLLLQTPAVVRFISAEPLLESINLQRFFRDKLQPGHQWRECYCGELDSSDRPCPPCWAQRGLDWVIVGGESGHGARPCDLAWVRAIVEQCQVANVACFTKQLGTVWAGGQWAQPGNPKWDRKGGDMSEWPADLRVREFPRVGAAV